MRIGAASIVAAGMVAAGPAQAQPSTSTGFPLGEKSRLHAGLTVGISYDTNPQRLETDVQDAKLLVRPGLSLDVPGSDVRLALGLHGSFFQYFKLSDGDTKGNTHLGADASLDFGLGSKRSAVAFSLLDTFTRTPTFIDRSGAIGRDEIKLKQWHNDLVSRLTFRPGGGALEFDIGYTNLLNIYDELEQTMRHGGLLEARYKFLPKTAAVFHADFTTFDVIGTPEEAQGATPTLQSTPYNVTLGLIGQLTTRITVDLGAGFGDTLTWTDSPFSSDLAETNQRTFIAHAQGKYRFNEQSNISLGYYRSLVPIIQLDNYVSNRARLGIQVGVAGRLLLGASGTYEHRAFGKDSRVAQLVIADARAGYHFFEFLSAAIHYSILFQDADENTGSAFLETFTRHQVGLTVSVRY